MDVENLLAKVAENLSVRRAFGTAYEKDGMLIIPVALVAGGGGGGTGTARNRRGNSAAGPGSPSEGAPQRTTRHRRTQGAWTPAGASAGWYCRRAPTS